MSCRYCHLGTQCENARLEYGLSVYTAAQAKQELAPQYKKMRAILGRNSLRVRGAKRHRRERTQINAE
jgi:hypothetical protein